MSKQQLTKDIVKYFESNIFNNHIKASLNGNSELRSFKINPIVVKYLSIVLKDEYSPEGVAKALYYPRVLGTSINTIFGTNIQKMFVDLRMADYSKIKGIDIEFKDKVDKGRKWCQLKAGPNTINSEDVNPIINKFTKTIRIS